MPQGLAVATQKRIEVEQDPDRDATRARGQLLVTMGAAMLVATAHRDFERELERELEGKGSIGREHFEELRNMLHDEIERIDGSAAALLDEDLQSVVP